MVDTIFADVAQPDQARIVAINAHNFLKNGGHFVISIKVCVKKTMLYSPYNGWTDHSLAWSKEITNNSLCQVLFASVPKVTRLLTNFQGCEGFLKTILYGFSWLVWHAYFLKCVIPEDIHTSPMEGIFSKTPPPLWKFQLSFKHFFKFFWPGFLLWGEYWIFSGTVQYYY